MRDLPRSSPESQERTDRLSNTIAKRLLTLSPVPGQLLRLDLKLRNTGRQIFPLYERIVDVIAADHGWRLEDVWRVAPLRPVLAGLVLPEHHTVFTDMALIQELIAELLVVFVVRRCHSLFGLKQRFFQLNGVELFVHQEEIQNAVVPMTSIACCKLSKPGS